MEPLIHATDQQIRAALESELLHCFAILEESKEPALRGFVLATVSSDPLTDTRTLLINCAVAVEPVDAETWADGILELVKFSKEKSCSRIMGFTQNSEVAGFAKQLGANSDFRLLVLGL
jgi:hypothetical protein